jgi:hypothetical protein
MSKGGKKEKTDVQDEKTDVQEQKKLSSATLYFRRRFQEDEEYKKQIYEYRKNWLRKRIAEDEEYKKQRNEKTREAKREWKRRWQQQKNEKMKNDLDANVLLTCN